MEELPWLMIFRLMRVLSLPSVRTEPLSQLPREHSFYTYIFGTRFHACFSTSTYPAPFLRLCLAQNKQVKASRSCQGGSPVIAYVKA